ncbi:uncharacterized protein LOC117283041 [Cryptotermes secundus]|uniref:uncharacterized protein LOC117283041 n=1 Tax=Cryptotermes secundus TaxID=105785 RepID=UPI001454C0E4|nr:uncharacterized protein LOC117283041 [Cryptotermes secundus]
MLQDIAALLPLYLRSQNVAAGVFQQYGDGHYHAATQHILTAILNIYSELPASACNSASQGHIALLSGLNEMMCQHTMQLLLYLNVTIQCVCFRAIKCTELN